MPFSSFPSIHWFMYQKENVKWFSFYRNNFQKSDCPGSFQHSILFFTLLYFTFQVCLVIIIYLLTCADVSNVSSNMSEIENAFTLCFLIGVITIFFSILPSIHLNDVQISDLQLDGRLIYKALNLILWLSSSEDCWSKIDSHLSPIVGLSDTSSGWSTWKNIVARMSWSPCLSLPLPLLWPFSFSIQASYSFPVTHIPPTYFPEFRQKDTILRKRTSRIHGAVVVLRHHCTLDQASWLTSIPSIYLIL